MTYIGLIFLGGVFFYELITYANIIYYRKNGIEIIATIVESYSKITRTDPKTLMPYYFTFAIYEFNYKGITYKVSEKGVGIIHLIEGEKIKIYINPNNPNKCLLPLKYETRNVRLVIAILIIIVFVLNICF